MTPQENEKLERLVQQAVRNLPARRAPSTLESRVRTEIARRAALPWWRKSFTYWPNPARAAFAVVCAALIKVVFVTAGWFAAGFDPAPLKAAFGPELHWAEIAIGCGQTVLAASSALLSSVPTLWIYGAGALIAALYIALFGLGAAAYRTLYASS